MIQVEARSEDCVTRAIAALEESGLQVLRSFDLQNAIAATPECTCPHHGTNQCTCQYTILLVYGAGRSPVSLAVHGRDNGTWLTLMPGGEPKAREVVELLLSETFSLVPVDASTPGLEVEPSSQVVRTS